MEKVLISACLLGAKVRYDGRDCYCDDPIVRRWLGEGRLVPICPETAAGLPIPRMPQEIVGVGGGNAVLRGAAVVTARNGEDRTHESLAGARVVLEAARRENIKTAVLKERSPSCGVDAIYDGTFSGTQVAGMGVAAALLHEHGVSVFPETRLADADAFIRSLERGSEPGGDSVTLGLIRLLQQHSSERVIVIGPTCTGKSTMLPFIPGAVDQDDEVFPKLSKTEAEYVCQTPWTEEIGRTMTRFVRERVQVQPGRPVFGTVVLECDFIVVLTISDALLGRRTRQRNVNFEDAANMQRQIRAEVEASGVPWVEYPVG